MALASTAYTPEVWAIESLMVLRNNLVMARLVHRDFDNVIAQAGDKVNTRKPTKLTAQTWSGIELYTDAATPSALDSRSELNVETLQAQTLTVTLDKLKYTSFIVEDKESALSIKNLRDEYIIPAMDPLAEAVDDDLVAEFEANTSTDFAGNSVGFVVDDSTGGDGLVPGHSAAAMNAGDIIAARKSLSDNQCPMEGRRLVLSTEHESDLLRVDNFVQANTSGNTDALTNANLGRKFGFDIYTSQNIGESTRTTANDDAPQSFAFHRNAITLVTRPLPPVPAGMGAVSTTQTLDDVSMRVTNSYEHRFKGVVVSFDILYGVKLMDANLGVLIIP